MDILHHRQLILVYIDFDRLLKMLLFTTPREVVLSVCMGVGGCFCPISSRKFRAGIVSQQLTKSAQSSASAAEDITALIIFDMVRTAMLLGVFSDLSVMKKCPPDLLWEPDSEGYEASLCPDRTISLAR